MMSAPKSGAAQLVHALCDDLQRVDVQARVRLVQERQGGLEHEHLQHLHALLLSAGEALVEIAVDEVLVHLHEVHGLAQLLDVGGDIHAAVADASVRPQSMARFRNLPTVTPAISTGYWKARKTPLSARSLVVSAR